MKKIVCILSFVLFVSFALADSGTIDLTYRVQVNNQSKDTYVVVLSDPHAVNTGGDGWIHYSSVNGQWLFPVSLPAGNSDFSGTPDASFTLKPGEGADVCAHAYTRGISANSGCIAVKMENQESGNSYLYQSNNMDTSDDDHNGLDAATQYKDFLSSEQISHNRIQSGEESLILINITQ